MNNIDWHYLKKSIVMFAVAVVISITFALLGSQFEAGQQEKYDKSLSTLRSTHNLYNNIINDIDLLDQYRKLYNEYKASGLIGEERRLSWVESLETTNGVLKLPTLTYSLQPQEAFERPGFKQKRGIGVKSSPMELAMGLLHEEDLFALLEGLRLSIKNLFTVESCSLRRNASIESSLETKRTNLESRCTIRWVTIDVE